MMVLRGLTASLLFALCFPLPAQAPPAPQAGLALTFAPGNAAQKQREGTVTVHARLLALHVEREESPTPLLSPGPFKARFAGSLLLPAGDRYRFRVVGKGQVTLQVNGKAVLSGQLRPDRGLDSEPVELEQGSNAVVATIASTALGEATLRLQWSGPGSAFEPIAPALWLCPDDPALQPGELLRRGQQLVIEHRCARCHQPTRPAVDSAFAELDNPAPDLGRAAARLHPGWMARWIADPHAVRSRAAMPKLPLSAAEVADLASYLGTLGRPLAEPVLTTAQRDAGGDTFLELGCIACHVPAGSPPPAAALGARLELGLLPAKWHGAALVEFLQAPATSLHMPDFRLSLAEAQALAAFLLDGRERPPTPTKGSAERGKRLAARVGCRRCHQLEVADASSFAELSNLRVKQGCLGPGRKAPDFHLGAEAVAALRAFLPFADAALFRRAPADHAERAIDSHRCAGCHDRDSEPSVWSRAVIEQLAPYREVEPAIDPVAQGVPALTWVGDKLQPSWLTKFVAGAAASPRPWLHARMPSFAVEGPAIVAGMLREHGFAAQDDVRAEPDRTLVASGQRLIESDEGLGCVQCHGIGERKPALALARQGIDFQRTAPRLRHDYFTRWLCDPRRIDPAAKMPEFAAAAAADGGDAGSQCEAIWQFLLAMR